MPFCCIGVLKMAFCYIRGLKNAIFCIGGIENAVLYRWYRKCHSLYKGVKFWPFYCIGRGQKLTIFDPILAFFVRGSNFGHFYIVRRERKNMVYRGSQKCPFVL